LEIRGITFTADWSSLRKSAFVKASEQKDAIDSDGAKSTKNQGTIFGGLGSLAH